MNKNKRGFRILLSLLQIAEGCLLVAYSGIFIYNWTIANKTSTFFPQIYQLLNQYFPQSSQISSIIVIAIIALLGIVLLFTAIKAFFKAMSLIKLSFNLSTIRLLICAVINAVLLYLSYWLLFSADGMKTASITCMIVCLLLVCLDLFSIMPSKSAKEPKKADQPQSDRSNQQQEAPLPPTEKLSDFITKEDFSSRIEQLIKLFSKKEINHNDFLNCANGLFKLPVNAPMELKINYLNKMISKKWLNSELTMVLYNSILSSRTTSTIKMKIQYLKKLYKKGIFDDTAYSRLLQTIMTSV